MLWKYNEGHDHNYCLSKYLLKLETFPLSQMWSLFSISPLSSNLWAISMSLCSIDPQSFIFLFLIYINVKYLYIILNSNKQLTKMQSLLDDYEKKNLHTGRCNGGIIFHFNFCNIPTYWRDLSNSGEQHFPSSKGEYPAKWHQFSEEQLLDHWILPIQLHCPRFRHCQGCSPFNEPNLWTSYF